MFSSNTGAGLAQFLGGLFGNSGDPYKAAMSQYQNYINQARGVQNPFLQGGASAIGNYTNWLNTMQNPSQFINTLMGQYQESPYAKYMQQQSMRAAQNMGSATGLTGSTPLQLQSQQNASNISSQDMNQWLQNVLGINQTYGAGQNNLIGYGSNAANALTQMYNNYGQLAGEAAYGQEAGNQNDLWNTIGGGLSLIGL